MLPMDMPYAPPQETPIVLAQAATHGATPQPDYILNECQETVSIGNPRSAMRAVDPAGMLWIYMQNRENRAIEQSAFKNIALLEDTTHGKITSVIDNTGRTWYRYDAEPEYVGEDGAVFMAEYQGVRYKIVVQLKVSIAWDEDFPECPEPQLIKVKKHSTGSSGYDMGSPSTSLRTGITVTFASFKP
jgi:hypothetical protein